MQLLPSNRTAEKLKVNLLYLGIITLITVITWIGFSVYQSFSKATVDTSIQKLIKSINPTLDIDTLSQFKMSRTAPPDQFQIISISRQNNQAVRQIIDPFSNHRENIPTASSSTLPVASSSTEMVP